MNPIIQNVRASLRQNQDEKVREISKRFFKEPIDCYGMKSAVMTNIAKEHYAFIKDLPKKELFEICETLWKSGMYEECILACNWSYNVRKWYQKEDFEIFKSWINRYITNWATCDTFCNHNMGDLIMMFPELLPELMTFTASENRWMKRAAAVSLIVPARKGMFLKEIFEIATIMLLDPDDMVQKGYGWMLKVASQTYQKEVFDFVMKNKSVMPRTALRYAIEKMPADLKKQAMAKD